MYLDLEPLQGKPWHEQIATLVNTAHRIAMEYQNPWKNDAKGTLDCYEIDDKLSDCRKILSRYSKADSEDSPATPSPSPKSPSPVLGEVPSKRRKGLNP